MHNQPVRLKLNKRTLVLLLALGLISFLMWQSVHANPIVTSFPAQVQIDQIMPSLDASEAEHASGAYLPGVGAVFIMDLIRGPNAAKASVKQFSLCPMPRK